MKKESGEGICRIKVENIINRNLHAHFVVVYMDVVKMERLGCIHTKFGNGIEKLVVRGRNEEDIRFLAKSTLPVATIWLLSQ